MSAHDVLREDEFSICILTEDAEVDIQIKEGSEEATLSMGGR